MTYVFVNIKTAETGVLDGEIFMITAVRDSEQREWRFKQTEWRVRDYMGELAELLGMSAAEIKSLPTFDMVADEIFDFIEPYRLVGFDCYRRGLPMLVEYFLRCGIDWDGWRFAIDAGELFKLHSPTALEAAVTAYCGRTHKQLHDTLADTLAIRDVFMRQVELHKLEGQNIVDICRQKRRPADPFCKLLLDESYQVCFASGVYRGEIVSDHVDFALWALHNCYLPLSTKHVLREEIESAQNEFSDNDWFGCGF